MAPPTPVELEVLLLVELHIASWVAVLITFGHIKLAALVTEYSRRRWAVWKQENDLKRQYSDLVVAEYQRSCIRPNNFWRDLKRKMLRQQEGTEHVKRRKRNWDHARAQACVENDWILPANSAIPRPLFDDLEFQRMFATTRGIVEDIIIPACVRHRPDVFCIGTVDAVGQKCIQPVIKVLNALKIARLGVGRATFSDYFQMGETSASDAFKALMDAMANDDAVTSKYRRSMTRADLQKVSVMHADQHGVEGMAFSIDCWHLHWKNCPVAWKGQLSGKEKVPTLVMEAGIDYNLWIWHAVFGYPGTQNDIQIWDQSPLYNDFLSGRWASEVDPLEPYQIGSLSTTKAWFPVDGIYPQISRFVKTIAEPINKPESTFAVWQEATRKDSERGFGVWGSKFRCLVRPVELHCVKEIRQMVYGCVAMHNMMVEYRLSLGVEEQEDLYSLTDETVKKIHDRTNVWIQKKQKDEGHLHETHHVNDPIPLPAHIAEDVDDVDSHYKLRDAIIEHLS